MNICKQTAIAATLVASAMLTGCGSSPPSAMTGVPASQATYGRYGVIESIQVVQVSNEKKGPGAGAVVGGIVGGILGNQVGGGLGNAAATAAGVVGGAIVGNNIEKIIATSSYARHTRSVCDWIMASIKALSRIILPICASVPRYT
ncbi:glycine zipper 2TM domain-containing protein [Undibacterium sp. KW1]|uniref:glycine zipper 2TM domain-containing protein n=1 Tax=Undibacterium sp. KW1 TaxID=2058624 RepID=UPI001E54DE8B|nr:glycine zipper 2TM domain-containing protein [Undibacterium sp. KW1]